MTDYIYANSKDEESIETEISNKKQREPRQPFECCLGTEIDFKAFLKFYTWCSSGNTYILAERSRCQCTLFTIASVVSLVISPCKTSTFTINSSEDGRYVTVFSVVAENINNTLMHLCNNAI